jgi:hypothetical protein
MTNTEQPPAATREQAVTGHRMSRNKHGEPVLTITLVGLHVINRFTDRMRNAQVEFGRMADRIRKAPTKESPWRIDNTVDNFQRYHVDGINDPVVTITLVGWHSIHRLAYNMCGWQVEFAAMGRKILRSHRRAVGRDRWRALWAMYHGEHEKPMTFTWKREAA